MFHQIENRERLLIYTCMDRISGEDIPVFIEDILNAGAKNVNIVPSLGKKGRSVFLSYIDIDEDIFENIIDLLVFKYRTTGWHSISSNHQFIKMEELIITIKFLWNQLEIDLNVPIKYTSTSEGRNLVLLEHNYCKDVLDQIISLDKSIYNISIIELKNQLKSAVINKLGVANG